MRYRELAHKFVFIMSDLPTKDLKQLADVLESPSEAREFSELVRNEIELRKKIIFQDMQKSLSRENSSDGIIIEDEYNDYIKAYSLFNRHTKSIDLVAHLFSDRNLFKNNEDIVQNTNKIFNLSLDYKDFEKQDRNEVVDECMEEIYKIPDEQQQKFFKIFVNNLVKSLEYRKLFKILSRNY